MDWSFTLDCRASTRIAPDPLHAHCLHTAPPPGATISAETEAAASTGRRVLDSLPVARAPPRFRASLTAAEIQLRSPPLVTVAA